MTELIGKLPHRPPFVFVDRVLEHQPGKSCTCIKLFDEGEPYFRGHFPGDPIVPGVLLTEALAQTAGLAVGTGERMLLSSIRKMTFPLAARPGEEIRLEATLTGTLSGSFLFDVEAATRLGKVASGCVVLSVPPTESD